jgi:hypothetical protein
MYMETYAIELRFLSFIEIFQGLLIILKVNLRP